jgi:hypothetical protein
LAHDSAHSVLSDGSEFAAYYCCESAEFCLLLPIAEPDVESPSSSILTSVHRLVGKEKFSADFDFVVVNP